MQLKEIRCLALLLGLLVVPTACDDGVSPLRIGGNPLGAEPTYSVVKSGSDGTVRFQESGASLVLRDLVTGTPLAGLDVVEIVGPETYYLITDSAGKYSPDIIKLDAVSADIQNGGALPALSVDFRDVYLVAAELTSGVTERLISVSDWLWAFIERTFYDEQTVPLADIPAILTAEYVAKGLVRQFSVHAIVKASGVTIHPVVTFVDIALGTLGLALNHYVINRYRSLGYGDADLFVVLVPNSLGTLFAGQVMIQPPLLPPAQPAALGSATVAVSLADGQPVTNAVVVASGPTSSQATTVSGTASFAELTPGEYSFTVTLPGFYPAVVLGTVLPGQNVVVQTVLHAGTSDLAFDASMGVAWFAERDHRLTALLVVMRSGPGGSGIVHVSGPPGWNGGKTAESVVTSTEQGRWDWYHFGPTAPAVTGWYTVELDAAGRRSVATVFLDATRTFAPPSNVVAQSIGGRRARMRWDGVPGANSYVVALADQTRCDSFNYCATVAVQHTDGSGREVVFDEVPLPPGTPYFGGVYATRTHLFLVPPPIPTHFDLGYAASPVVHLQADVIGDVAERVSTTKSNMPRTGGRVP